MDMNIIQSAATEVLVNLSLAVISLREPTRSTTSASGPRS